MNIDYESRIKNLRKSLKTNFAILFSQDQQVNPNLFYLTGYKGLGILIISKNINKETKKFDDFFIASPLDLCNLKHKKLNTIILKGGLKTCFEKTNVKINKNTSISLDYKNTTLEFEEILTKIFGKFKKENIAPILLDIRSFKDQYEINQTKKACKITSNTYKLVIEKLKNNEFKTESEIKNFIDIQFKLNKTENAFETIVASKENAANPHYHDSNKKLKKGFLLIDMGCKLNGYCADMTRTCYLGKPSKKEIEDYNKVLKSQLEALNKFKINKLNIADIDKNVKSQLGDNYIHSLGHGIGIECHELPHVNVLCENKIEENQIFTVEPGIYFEGKYGIRIEDSVLKTKEGIEILTKYPKKLKIIDF